MASDQSMRGLCYGCGTRNVSLRWDKKSRPFLRCGTCASICFFHGDGAAFRALARMVLDAENPSGLSRVQELAGSLIEAARAKFGPEVAVGDGLKREAVVL